MKAFEMRSQTMFGALFAMSVLVCSCTTSHEFSFAEHPSDGGVQVQDAAMQDAEGNLHCGLGFSEVEGVCVQTEPIVRRAYLWPSTPTSGFGAAVAVSADGQNVLVGDPPTASVHSFVRRDGVWAEQAVIHPWGTQGMSDGAGFGSAIALSLDSATLVVASDAMVYVFSASASGWSESAGLVGKGVSVAISADGSTIAVGDPSSSAGPDGMSIRGSVTVWGRSSGDWSQLAFLNTSQPDDADGFGWSVSLSGAGSMLAVGSLGRSGNALHVYNQLPEAGWVGRLAPSLPSGGGTSVTLSTDAMRLAVGIPISPDGSALNSGVVYVFHDGLDRFRLEASLTDPSASGTSPSYFGANLAFASSGQRLVILSADDYRARPPLEPPSQAQVVVNTFDFDARGWQAQGTVALGNDSDPTSLADGFALSADGLTLAVVSPGAQALTSSGNPVAVFSIAH